MKNPSKVIMAILGVLCSLSIGIAIAFDANGGGGSTATVNNNNSQTTNANLNAAYLLKAGDTATGSMVFSNMTVRPLTSYMLIQPSITTNGLVIANSTSTPSLNGSFRDLLTLIGSDQVQTRIHIKDTAGGDWSIMQGKPGASNNGFSLFNVGSNTVPFYVNEVGLTTVSNLTVDATAGITGNTTSRSQGVAVSDVSSTINTLIQGGIAVYSGATTNIAFPITYAAAPTSVQITRRDNIGTAVLNDVPYVSAVTTTNFTLGMRTAAGAASTITCSNYFTAFGRQ